MFDFSNEPHSEASNSTLCLLFLIKALIHGYHLESSVVLPHCLQLGGFYHPRNHGHSLDQNHPSQANVLVLGKLILKHGAQTDNLGEGGEGG